MSYGFRNVTFLIFVALILIGCGGADTAGDGAAETANAAPVAVTAEILETMDSGGYTYVRLKTGDGETWAAGPLTPVAVGDTIVLSDSMAMNDFHSPSLDRTFDSILFLPALSKPGEAGTGGAMPSISGEALPVVVEAGTVPKAEGGYTVAELYAGKAELAGAEVAVIGRVVKYNGNIMGRNWLHLQDGSGETGTNDLTVTTGTEVQVGDVVLAKGALILDRDFGSGYYYDLIIEDAVITVQP